MSSHEKARSVDEFMTTLSAVKDERQRRMRLAFSMRYRESMMTTSGWQLAYMAFVLRWIRNFPVIRHRYFMWPLANGSYSAEWHSYEKVKGTKNKYKFAEKLFLETDQ